MNTHGISKKTNILLCGFLFAFTAISTAQATSLTVTKTWGSGDTLTAADLNNSFDEVESAVSDNDTRITNIEAQKFLTLNPYSAILGGNATISGGFGFNAGIKFTDVATSSFGLGFVIPPDYESGDPITVNLIWHTSSAACGIEFRPNSIAVARSGQTHLTGGGASTGLSTIGGNTLTAPTTSNQSSLKQVSITAPDGTALNPGDSVIFSMFRFSAHAADTCTGDLVVQGVSVMY